MVLNSEMSTCFTCVTPCSGYCYCRQTTKREIDTRDSPASLGTRYGRFEEWVTAVVWSCLLAFYTSNEWRRTMERTRASC
jgi:hypothetical protein